MLNESLNEAAVRSVSEEVIRCGNLKLKTETEGEGRINI